MDDLGADQLCKISCNQTNQKDEQSAIFDTASGSANTSTTAINSIGDRLGMRLVKKTTINNDSKSKTKSNNMNCNVTEKDNAIYSSNINNSSSDLRSPSRATYVAGGNHNSQMMMMGAAVAGVVDCHDGDSVGGLIMEEDSADEEKEKTDATPENVKKIDDVIASKKFNNEMSGSRKQVTTTTTSEQGDDDDDDVGDYGSIELKIVEDESPTKQNLAFTIEFSKGESSTAVTASRYKNMVERFQNRHRRGASLSKLDDQSSNSSTQTIGTTPSTINRTSRTMSSANQQNSTAKQQKGGGGINEISDSESNKVKLRIRERSTSGVRDASKRHSWSPRSSSHEPLEQQQHQIKSREKQQPPPIPRGGVISSGISAKNKEYFMNSNSKQTVRSANKLNSKPIRKVELSQRQKNDTAKQTTTAFTPRSTALQLAMNKMEFICPEPPLDDFTKNKNIDGDGDSVSETGTYTVDGDNYTEEQKDLMNIDKSAVTFAPDILPSDTTQLRPNELPLYTTNTVAIENQKQRNNILEINYYHDSTSLKPKISYLEKIKSRVRNIAKSPDKKLNSPTDMGVFTSVTTSGVLSVKPTLDFHPKVNRRNSLTKSHVDSSEYVSTGDGNFKDNNSTNQLPFTDHQKAEYKLNLFTASTVNQTDSQILNENYSDVNDDVDVCCTPVTPDSPSATSFSKSICSETGLKTAQSKNDWIQEWARNARARSQSATTTSNQQSATNEQMSRSYNFEAVVDTTGFGDNHVINTSAVPYRNKVMVDRFRAHTIGDYEYSSDPNVSIIKNANNNSNNALNTRPPMSPPSKIPSPMHSVGRTRSASRTRGSLQDLSPLKSVPSDNTDIYLQKTAAAISNLTHSVFSRKNSLQSSTTHTTTKSPPPSSSAGNSPRHHIYPQHYSADEYSPTHTSHYHNSSHHNHNHHHHHHPPHQQQQQQQQHYHHNDHLHHHHNSGHHQLHQNVHKRNLSFDYRNNLMSHSLNTDTLATILTATDKHQQRTNQSGGTNYSRSRQHSYDASANYDSPKFFQRKAYIDQTGMMISSSSIKQFQQPSQQSPIRRSSSFSTKPMSGGNSSKQQQQSGAGARNAQKCTDHIKNSIQKSASSTSFRKMYSDYDDNIPYYINDEDDLIDVEYYGSSDDYDDSDQPAECYAPPEPIAVEPSEPPEPLTNTRCNKALLMRIEKTKQRVAGMQGKASAGGVIACPNTPEMPRRAVQSASRASVRQSVPRDSSLSRLKAEVPNSLASAKKQLLQTAAATTTTTSTTANLSKKIQPKYMDISKYKPVQGASFLRKDETKSTLMTRSTEIKRSPSSASVSLNRGEPTRASNRSAKSASSGRPGCGKREPIIPKQKEVELAMWKRRATYDPMKSAAEDRKRKEEAKRLAQSQGKSTESSVVSRSQSFHSGVTIGAPRLRRGYQDTCDIHLLKNGIGGGGGGSGSGSGCGNTSNDESNNNYRWTLTSTESSDGENDGDSSNVNVNDDDGM